MATRKGKLKWKSKSANRGRKGGKKLKRPRLCKSNK
jgi:hypothetical protein